MALINCPECGKQVSTNAAQCVHCGYKFKICPECNTVCSENEERCTNCGYAFSSSTVNDAEADKLVGDNLIEEWKKSTPSDQNLIKIFKYIDIISWIVILALVAIVVIILLNWKWGDTIEKIESLSDVKSFMRWIVAFVCIGLIIESVKEYVKDACIKIRFSRWLKNKKVDCTSYIAHQLEINNRDDKTGKDKNFALIEEGCWITDTTSAKTCLYIFIIVRFLVGFVLAVCSGILIMDMFDNYCKEQIMSEKINFNIQSFIPFAVALLVDIASAVIIKIIHNEILKKWRKCNFKDNSN